MAIHGAHVLLFSRDAEADRTFCRDVLGFPAVDAGGGWLIFALPPAEVAVHPSESGEDPAGAGEAMLGAVLYLMCDDLRATMAELGAKGVRFTAAQEAPWGIVTTFALPSGGQLGLYQPTHPTALGLSSR
ncbi:MAG TPA: VOC family protein [Thermoanaerobaculia bacterium]|jgi:catechol 2,3-dioxygenase-like lactoylglutathione lyase family enzyme|nr:VOC family protein [Thermoanaerobaculia bacterium]